MVQLWRKLFVDWCAQRTSQS